MSDDIIGRQLGQYTIESFLSKGGMARVYVAAQPSVERKVAIKVMEPELAQNAEFVTRFQREASMIAQLQHPHILPVIDFGQEDDFLYLVMRLVSGEGLDVRLTKGRLPVGLAVELLRQIGSALAVAHEHGIIHRDLKPSNVLLDEHDNAYLADFGIAKMVAAEGLTETHGVVGTPHYMAPEQWTGTSVDTRADLYSLGVLAYQMLTGELPFRAETPYELMHHHINTPPPAITRHYEHVPYELETIIHKALDKEPDDRFQSALEMVQAFLGAGHSTDVGIVTALSEALADQPPLEDAKTMSTDPMEFMPTTKQPMDIHLTDAPVEAGPTVDRRLPVPGRWMLLGAGLVAIIAIVAVAALVLTGGDDSNEASDVSEVVDDSNEANDVSEVVDDSNDVNEVVDDNPPAERVLLTDRLEDDFSENTLGWDRNEANRYFEDGQYHTLTLPGEGGSGLAIAQDVPLVDDFRLDISAENRSDTAEQMTYAIVFRLQDTANYYRFTITSDGQAGVIRRLASNEATLVTTTLNDWDAEATQHRFSIEMLGPQMTLYVDDEVVLREIDNTLPAPGGIGLVAFREGAHIAWDDLSLTPITHLSDPLELAQTPYLDDFEANDCPWANQYRIGQTIVAQLNAGQYQLQVPPGQDGIQVQCPRLGLYGDLRLTVTVDDRTPQGIPSAYGLMLRQSVAGDTFYLLVVNDRGQMSLQKFLAADPDCQPCIVAVEPIPQYIADDLHTLTVEAVGNRITGRMDGRLVLDVTDADIPDAGIVRLGAYLPGAQVAFDDLIIAPHTPLPDLVAVDTANIAPLVLSEAAMTVELPEDAGVAAAIESLPVHITAQDFVLAATIRFDTETNDQCGFGFRSVELDRFQWLNLSASGALGYGNEVNQPSSPLLLETVLDSPRSSLEVLLVAEGETITVYLDGERITLPAQVADDDPIAGRVFTWLVLAGNHAAACHFEDMHLWSLDG